MQVNLTREIILDLVPVYLAGEASDDTKKLVEEFAKTDTQLASILSVGELEIQTTQTPNLEMETLKTTRRKIKLQAWQLALAIVCTIFVASLGWLGTFLAIVFWVIYYRSRSKLHDLIFGQ